MAGGIDWFRWHHGSVTDPKFQLVARRSGASLPDVLAVWAYILELASASQDRGSFGDVDAEAIDCLFNFPEDQGRTAAILQAMEARGLTEAGRVTAWAKRQPKREDDSAADRKRAQRQREAEAAVTQRDESACHAVSRDVTLEESREEKNSSSLRSEENSRAPKAFTDEFETAWSEYPTRPGNSKADAFKAWNARLKAGATPEQLTDGVRRYARFVSATQTEAKFVKQAATFFGPGEHYLADWTPPARASPAGETDYQRQQRERYEEMTGKRPAASDPNTIDMPLSLQ